MIHRLILLLVATLVAWDGQAADQRNPTTLGPAGLRSDGPPNVVVIMVDDLGYSDLGCYGSEIETPNLDRLAGQGLRFSQFYNTAKCHSSRVSLLSGQYCIAAGDVALSHAVTSAEVLRNGGYFTAMTGKWHLDKQPTDFGFDRYFGHLSGACNFFKGDQSFRLNGQPWKVPDDGFYTTVADVDYAIDFLDQARQTSKPWYLYVAFNAPHEPLHALPEDYAKYQGRYDEGWDVVRAARVEKQKRIGVLPTSSTPSPRPEHVPAWETMQPWRQKYEANRMTTLAAMIDRVDQEVGRLIEDLASHGELENTFLLFVSDNGACPYDRRRPILDAEPTNGDVFFADSTGWAWARNSPFRYYKQNQFEGGISTPAIVHWPAGLKTEPGSIVHDPAHLIDVMPTLAEITDCDIPTSWPDRELRPVSGISLKPIFDGGMLNRPSPIHLLFSKDRGLRDGDWKAVSFRATQWELYNMTEDRTELNNLAASDPERLDAMVQTWTQMTEEVLHAGPNAFGPVSDADIPHRHPEWTNYEQSDPTQIGKYRPGKTKSKSKKNHLSIRARKNTKMRIRGSSLELQFTGDDPGIAMDLRGVELPAGPYQIAFELSGGGVGGGELFYTTNAQRSLPKGERVEFDVNANGEWQLVLIELPTKTRIHQLRIDVSDEAGTATIKQLRLTDSAEKVLLSWP